MPSPVSTAPPPRGRIGTGVVEQRLELAGGQVPPGELAQPRSPAPTSCTAAGSDEFRFVFGGELYSGESGDYRLRDFEISRLAVPKASPGIEPGVALDIDLDHPRFLIRLHYEAFASTPRTPLGMVRKWYRVTNRTAETQPLTEISMNHLRLRNDLAPKLTLYWWRGGGADAGHQQPARRAARKATQPRISFSRGSAGLSG